MKTITLSEKEFQLLRELVVKQKKKAAALINAPFETNNAFGSGVAAYTGLKQSRVWKDLLAKLDKRGT